MIVLDIDGVVADFFEELVITLNKCGHDFKHWTEWPSYNWEDICPDVSRDTLNSFLLDPLVVKNSKAFGDAWHWVNHYSSRYDVMYLTARDISLSPETWDWFFEWDIPADFVVFEKNKPEFVSQIEVSVYVDDHPEMAQGAKDLGVNAFLLNRPYNMSADVDPSIRINSLWEVELP
jgi:uncharacterized HAD superfamily protein